MTIHSLNQETINNRAKLLMHRLVARRLAIRPEIIETAKRSLTFGPKSLHNNQEWLDILVLDPLEVRNLLTSRSSKMDTLRISSPFASFFDLQDPDLRKRIWRMAKKGIRSPSEQHAHVA